MHFRSILSAISISSASLLIPFNAAYAEEQSTEADSQPVIEVIVPDIGRLKQRFSDSIYGRLWNDPSNQRFKELFDSEARNKLTEIKNRDGIDLELVLSQIRNGGARLFAIDSNAPEMSAFQAYVTFNDEAAAELMRLPLLDNAAMLDVNDIAGADEAFISDDGNAVLSRFANTIVFSDPENISVPKKPTDIQSDLEFNFAATTFFDAMLDMAYAKSPQEPRIPKQDIQAVLAQFDQLTHSVTIKEAGLLEEIFYIGPEKSGLKAVDPDLLKRLPAHALLAGAFGINGSDLWKEQLRNILDIVAKQDPNKSADEIIQEVNNLLNLMGIDSDLSSICAGIDGTFFFCVTPSAPYPALSIGVPRSPSLDAVIEALLLARFNIMRPPQGSIESINIQAGIPPIQLSLSEDYWMISTDIVFTKKWLNNQSGGWDQSPSGQAAIGKGLDGAFLVGGMDTQQIVKIARSLLGILLFTAKGEELENVNTLIRILQQLQNLAEPGYIVGKQENRDYSYEIFSLTGSGPLLLGPGAAVFRQRQQQRRRAWREAAEKREEEMRKLEEKQEVESIDDL